MGLDLVVEGAAKPGHHDEWLRLLQRSFSDQVLSEAEIARFNEISVRGYENIGAPKVGRDIAADQWILQARRAETPDEKAAILKEFDGYYAVRLVSCDGVSNYSNGGLYDGVDATSFRGALLEICRDVLTKDMLNKAWSHKLPHEAVAYGKDILALADAAQFAGNPPKRRRSFLSRIGLAKEPEPVALAEQLDIVRSAGRWFIFWGERGHPIRAWF